MFNIKTLNSISSVYRDILPEDAFRVDAGVENPDAILVRSAAMHDMEIGENLLAVARAGAGTNNIPLEKMADKGVVVFNSPGANANAVRELAITALLLSSRKIYEGMQWAQTLKEGDVSVEKQVEKGKGAFVGPEIAGKTLGVIGLGAVGVLVANTGYALGMNVLGYDPYISVEHAWRLSRAVKHAASIEEVLENSDYISIHVPLMDATKNYINAENLKLMKPTAALINLSRGGLVNNDAVKAALSEGKLRVYMTDFPSGDLLGVPGVIATPHLGASTPESEDNCVVMVAHQIRDYLETGAIVNSVNYPDCQPGRLVGPRLCVLHKNVPSVISAITSRIGASGINIENMVNKSRGNYACTILDLGIAPDAETVRQIDEMDAVYRARLILA